MYKRRVSLGDFHFLLNAERKGSRAPTQTLKHLWFFFLLPLFHLYWLLLFSEANKPNCVMHITPGCGRQHTLIGPHPRLKRLKQQIVDSESSNALEQWKVRLIFFFFFCSAGVSYRFADRPVSQGWGRAEHDCWYFYFPKSRLATGERKQP